MAIAHVQDAANTAAPAGATRACTISTTGGNTLVVCVIAATNSNTPITISSITDTASNHWNFTSGAGSAVNTPPTGGAGVTGVYSVCAVGYCVNAAAVTSVTVTINLSPAYSFNVSVSEFSGVPSNWGLDVAASTGAFVASSSQATPSVTPAGSPELAFAAADSDNGYTSLSGGYTAVTGMSDQAGWLVTTGAGAQSCTFSYSSSQNNYAADILVLGPPPAVNAQPAPAMPWPPALAATFGPGWPFTARGFQIDPVPATTAYAGLPQVAAAGLETANVQPVGSPTGGPWVLSFSDDFDVPVGGKPNPSVWSDHHIIGDTWRCNTANPTESEWYPHSQAGSSVSSSTLTLTGRFEDPRSSSSVGYDPACPTTLANGNTPSYSSGWYQSKPGFAASYGYWEVRAKMPDGGGSTDAWPGLWAWGADAIWGPEFDLVEWFSANGHAGYFNDSGTKLLNVTYTGDGAYHVWGLRWTPTDITLFKDGVSWGSYTTAAGITSNPIHWNLQLAAQFASGTGFPCTVQIDYVRHWTVQGVPAQPAAPTALSPSTGIPSSGSVQVSFSTVAGATSYRVLACPVDAAADGVSLPTGTHTLNTGTSSPITVTGLTNGARYAFSVAAINSTGYSIESPLAPPMMGGVLATPGVATVAAAGLGATGSVSLNVNAGLPQASAVASPPTAAARAAAGLPDVLAAGLAASAADTATAGLGTVLAAAPSAVAAEGAAAGTGTVLAAAPAPSAAETATPAVAIIDAAALAATVSTSGGTSAPAGLAQVLAVAPSPSAAVQVTAGLGTVLAATALAVAGNATATAGTGTVASVALPPVMTLSSNATAGLASVLAVAGPVPAQHVVAEATAAVTDPRDGTRTVTNPDTSAPGVT